MDPSPGQPTDTETGLDEVESSLTWIWGSPRSGSSWLLELLCHPAQVDRDARLGFRLREGSTGPAAVIPADEPSFGHHLAPFDGAPVAFYEEWLPGSIINGSEKRPTYLLSEEHAGTWEPWMRGLVLARLGAVRREAAEMGIATPDAGIVVKETPSGHAADRVMGLLPRSRALLLTRDPRDVVDSLMHAMRPGGFMARQFGVSIGDEDRADGVLWAARTWAMSMDVAKHALAGHDPSLARTVRYEDLLADPAGITSELLSWLGRGTGRAEVERAVGELAFGSLPSDSIGKLERNRSATPGAWRENLSPAEAATVAEIAGERLERYGYSA